MNLYVFVFDLQSYGGGATIIAAKSKRQAEKLMEAEHSNWRVEVSYKGVIGKAKSKTAKIVVDDSYVE